SSTLVAAGPTRQSVAGLRGSGRKYLDAGGRSHDPDVQYRVHRVRGHQSQQLNARHGHVRQRVDHGDEPGPDADKYARGTDCYPHEYARAADRYPDANAHHYARCGDADADANARAADGYPDANANTEKDTHANTDPEAQQEDADSDSMRRIQKR